MRERLGQPSQRPLTATEKYGELGRDKRFCSSYNVPTPLRNLQNRSLACMERGTL